MQGYLGLREQPVGVIEGAPAGQPSPIRQSMSETPRNKLVGMAADNLAYAQAGLDMAAPLPGKFRGLGTLLWGDTPQEVDHWSYGESPFMEGQGSLKFVPELKEDRKRSVADTLFFNPASDVAAVRSSSCAQRLARAKGDIRRRDSVLIILTQHGVSTL